MTETGDREVARKIGFALFWIPFQLTFGLIFATGGVAVIVVLGILFSPLIGLAYLIRRALRDPEDRAAD